MKIWEEEPVLQRINQMSDSLRALWPRFLARPDVENVRQTGTIAALDVRAPERGYLSDVAPKLYRYFLAHGVLLRPIGRSIYVLPPYCTSRADLDFIVNTIEGALDALRDGELEPAA